MDFWTFSLSLKPSSLSQGYSAASGVLLSLAIRVLKKIKNPHMTINTNVTTTIQWNRLSLTWSQKWTSVGRTNVQCRASTLWPQKHPLTTKSGGAEKTPWGSLKKPHDRGGPNY
jgi:hypothetical protein